MSKVYLRNKHRLDIPKFKLFYQCFNIVCNYHNLKQSFVNIDIVTIEKITLLNKSYLHNNKPTNVISFPFEYMKNFLYNSKFNYFLGDIFISPEVLKYESAISNKFIDHHWCHILIHSVLHLLGYDHINHYDTTKMQSLEIFLLSYMNISNPYI